MAAKILAFDPNRKIPPRHYVPMAMRGRLLQMPVSNSEAASAPAASQSLCWSGTAGAQDNRRQG